MATTPLTILKKAKTILIERGWTQDSFYKNGSFCALGAIEAAGYGITYHTRHAATRASRDFEVARAVHAAERAVARGAGKRVYNLIEYNDRQGRTKDEVIAAFDRAIEGAEAAGA